MFVISILLLAIGLAVVLNTIFAGGDADQVFPRPGAPTARTRRLMRALPISIGLLLALAGLAVLLVSLPEAP